MVKCFGFSQSHAQYDPFGPHARTCLERFCKKIRMQEGGDQTFIIMVTAKAEEIDRLRGFEVGADDYVTKPFVMKELLFRIKAALRRQQNTVVQTSSQIKFGPFEVNTISHKAFLDDNEIILTSLEFRLLHTFLTRRGAVQTREKLLEDVSVKIKIDC